jgi:ribosomal protein L24E
MTYVEISGRILHFCSSKCINNWKLGRDAKRCKWVTKQADVQAATKKANAETLSHSKNKQQ